MSGENPYPSKNNELIWQELDAYFGNVGQDSREENIRLAGPSVDRWGRAFVVGGFSWVAESIEREGVESARLSMFGMSDQLLNLRLFSLARRNFGRLRDVVSISGADTGVFLIANIGVPGDEDEAALNSYMLASDFIPTIDSMKLEVSKIYLKNVYNLAVGTSCRMAMAWALYNMGEKKEWESMVYGNQFVRRDFLDRLEETIRENGMDLEGQDVKSVLCQEYAVPGSTNLVPEFVIGDMGIFETLTLDIASDGRAFKNNPSWQRKPKKGF